MTSNIIIKKEKYLNQKIKNPQEPCNKTTKFFLTLNNQTNTAHHNKLSTFIILNPMITLASFYGIKDLKK
jgi:hypothetical protein